MRLTININQETPTMIYPTVKLRRDDAKRLNAYQHAKHDPATGLVWIEDGSAGIGHSAHPNVEANKYSRSKYPGWIEVRGFLYSPDRFPSTDLDRLAAAYCQCPGCQHHLHER